MTLFSPTRRTLAVAAGVATLLLAAAGCSRGGSSGTDGAALEFFVPMGSDTAQYEALTEIVEAFEEDTGASVEIVSETTSYEDQMKVKLASGDIPDLFATHGWSLLRYSQFLEPLTDQPWADDVNPSLDSAMRDSNGDIYAFPAETDVSGIMYNEDVLDAAGIDPESLTTWEAFDAAAAAVAETGTSAIFSSGKAQGPAGLIADFLAIDSFDEDQLAAMKEGTFVSDAYITVLERLQTWQANGWFNKDYSSASLDDMARALAYGETAFEIGQTSTLGQALAYNPDANVGFLPLPPTLGPEPYLVGGEGVAAFGVSKSSENKQTALDLLSVLAEPDNAAALAEATGSAPGLTTVDVDFGGLASSFDAYVTPGTTAVLPYFDRVYLPNGSWNTMVATADSVITAQSTPAAAVEQMESQYDTLYGQQ